MANEILSIKLYELDEKICRMHSRISLSESARAGQMTSEIAALRKECAETEEILRRELKFSRAGAVSKLSKAYTEVEQIIQETRDQINGGAEENESEIPCVEEKILFAEYALDFAMQAANYALLISMEAIDAQMTLQEKEERSLS